MGFGDIFKKALAKGVAFTNTSVDNTQPQKEKSAEEIARKRELAEQKKQQKLAEILKPSCEKGDCLWHAEKFYFTCDDCVECQRKKTTKKHWGSDLVSPELWPYMKRIEYINNIKENPTKLFKEQDEFIKDFMAEQMPAFKSHKEIVKLNFIFQGITLDNPFFALLWYLKDKNVKLTGHMMDKLQWQNINGTILHLDLDFYKNPSLYKRSDEEFDYTVKIFEIVMDPEKLAQYYDPESININDLFNSKGNIKAAGIGGPQAGFYGDTIWNTIESWDEI